MLYLAFIVVVITQAVAKMIVDVSLLQLVLLERKAKVQIQLSYLSSGFHLYIVGNFVQAKVSGEADTISY